MLSSKALAHKKEYNAKYQQEPTQRVKQRLKRLEKLAWMSEFKRVPCKDCGNRFPTYVMDFDHRDPTLKIRNIAAMMKCSKEKILEEMSKCDVVCSNCHRIRTWDNKCVIK